MHCLYRVSSTVEDNQYMSLERDNGNIVMTVPFISPSKICYQCKTTCVRVSASVCCGS